MGLAVTDRERTLFAGGVGVRDLLTQEAVSATTLFSVASTTKAFTTTLLAMLHDEARTPTLLWQHSRALEYLSRYGIR